MTTAITPEVVGLETAVLEDSPMTPAEQRKLVELETKIKTKLGNKMEADLAIGSALLQIQRERLYRGPEGGRKFEDYIKEESHRLTPDNQPIGKDTAERLRGFYYFREEVLAAGPPAGGGAGYLPLPTSAYQVRPLLFLLDHLHRDAEQLDPRRGSSFDDRRAAEAKAIEIWKAAVTEAKGKAPTFDQVNRARLADQAAAEQHRLRGSANSSFGNRLQGRSPIDTPPSKPCANSEAEAAAHQAAQEVLGGGSNSSQSSSNSGPSSARTISAWDIEKDDNALDAGAECKRITQAINDAHKAIGLLRGILYSQINKYGRDYLGFLRQVDAGVYSLHNINDQVQQMGEDIEFISQLLVADVGEGELAQRTVEAVAFPSRA